MNDKQKKALYESIMKSVAETVKKQLNEAASPELEAFIKKGEIQYKASYIQPGKGDKAKLTQKEMDDLKKIGAFLEKLGYTFNSYLSGHVDAQLRNREGDFYLDHYDTRRNDLVISLKR